MPEPALIVFADYVCPFCFLAEAAVARLRRDGVQVDGAALELRPAGTPLPDPGAAWMKDAWGAVVEPLADELGVVMRYPTLTTRTRKAHEAAAYARSAGRFSELHDALYRAYWQEQRDIGRIDVLADIAAEHGLDRTAMKVALDIDQWTHRVEQDAARARAFGVTGVPAFVLDDAGAQPVLRTGLQRYEDLKAWVRQYHDV